MGKTDPKINDAVTRLRQHLFSDPELNAYVILDGASIPKLQDQIFDDEPEYRCLYTGNLPDDILDVAPWVVRLEEESPFTEWVLEEGWGNHWGIFALTNVNIQGMRKHLRTLIVVESPEGQNLIFRFYDPRVMRIFLPTCNKAQLRAMFGPIKNLYLEGDEAENMLSFHCNKAGLQSNLDEQVA